MKILLLYVRQVQQGLSGKNDSFSLIVRIEAHLKVSLG